MNQPRHPAIRNRAGGLFTALPMALLAIAGAQACSRDTAPRPLASLAPVGHASTVCLMRGEDGQFTVGRPIDECPDRQHGAGDPQQRRLFVLATQPTTGEVAVVDLAAGADQEVVDNERTQPGFSFLPIGAEPVELVATPGGMAAFASVRESGREGIFALPSTCIQQRQDDEPARDLRTWPACRLPSAPGPMQLLFDPTVSGMVRSRCDADYQAPEELVGVAPAASRESCPADLALEGGWPGRRKLAVAMPEHSEIWILDAQELLDREPGTFDWCRPERRVALSGQWLAESMQRPPELQPSEQSCALPGPAHGPRPDAFTPYPVDFALDEESRLYVADSQTPLVHVLDATDPCDLRALEPLQPQSLTRPDAIITTRKVAVSPLTPGGKRFVYAIDDSMSASAGTVMAFDVSPQSTQRTPIVRERANYLPLEDPDRITVQGHASDVEFVFLDFPNSVPRVGSTTVGVQIEGVACEPNPNEASSDSLEASYRDSASPAELRGTFAYVTTFDGQVHVVDVEDLDAQCRRPIPANPGPQEDLAGCKNDPSLPDDLFADGDRATVSGELSCHVVTPHWPRSRTLFSNRAATPRSAALRSFPTLTLQTGRAVATDQSEEGINQPKMLAARHVTGEDEVLAVGAVEYQTGEGDLRPLDVDPSLAERNSLLFSYEAPRAFLASGPGAGEDFAATYEGVVRSLDDDSITVDDEGFGLVEGGVNARFCSAGVQDMAVTSARGVELQVASSDLGAFARRHADYVQVAGALLPDDDEYWQTERGTSCGRDLFQLSREDALAGRALCEQFYGPVDVPTTERDLRIVEAFEDVLVVEPRSFDPTRNTGRRRREMLEFLSCCFPEPVFYQVRAGAQWLVRGSLTGAPHPIDTDPESRRCVRSCDPLVSKLNSRAFEISCGEGCPTDATGRSGVGPAVPGQDFACVVNDYSDGIDPDEPGAECVFQSLTSRFAIYRGQQPSSREMRFRWQLQSGFVRLSTSVTGNSSSVPLSLVPVPQLEQLVVPDGTASGLTLLAPRNLRTTYIF